MLDALPVTFGDFRIDPANACLWRGHEILPLTPKTFAVLRYLAEHPSQLVTKEDLFQAIWPETVVGDAVLSVSIAKLRKALGDDPRAPQFIATVHTRGYRFIGCISGHTPVLGSQYSGERSSHSPVRSQQRGPAPQQGGTESIRPVPRLVGRQAELAKLHELFEKALRGERQVIFITGEPGIGKTALVEEFLQHVATTGGIWISRGQCIEHYGVGEPYLPVLDALGQLCRAAGGWRPRELLSQAAPTWLVQIPALLSVAELEALQRKTVGVTRERMLREMADALEVLTAETPLVLWLEDLHWSDYATLDLLSFLARRCQPARLVVIGTYRPADVILQEHPLRTVKQELQLHGQCAALSLGFLTKAAVREYLTVRFPRGQFPEALSQVLYRRTDGNPLFIVNVMEDWVAQGVLVEREGHWELRTTPEELEQGVPQNLRLMIEHQVARLNPQAQRMLEAASTAGDEFSATVIVACVEENVEAVEEQCTALVRQGYLLQARGAEEWPDGTLTTRYGFVHALYRTVVYERIPAARRVQLHKRVGTRLEAGYGVAAGELAAQLALHFERARDFRRAVQYLQRAAETAARRSAHQEGISHLTKALELLGTLPETPERRRQEIALLISLGPPLIATKGWAAPEVGASYARARVLCEQGGDIPKLFPALYGIWVFHYTRAELHTAQELAEQLLTLAEKSQDAALRMEAHHALGNTLHRRGELTTARAHLEQGIALYDPQQHRGHASLYGLDDGVAGLGYVALVLWVLGYLDQARERIHEMLTLARELSHPLSLAWAYNITAWHHQFRREGHLTQAQAEAGIALCTEHGFAQLLAVGTILRGWALAAQGKGEEGIVQMHQGLAACQETGAQIARPRYLAMLAEAYGATEQATEGLGLLAEAVTVAQTTGERFFEAECHRLMGELLLKSKIQSSKPKGGKSLASGGQSAVARAEECFQQAIDLARRQHAKALELRAVQSLSRLWQRQGKKAEARQMLAEIYSWFTEGFDTKDLEDAKTLLQELA
jgi:predicted ATPase/DNA-binding winged helix-turn-helix (wHTH) protein